MLNLLGGGAESLPRADGDIRLDVLFDLLEII